MAAGMFFVDSNAARHFDNKGATGCSLDCDRSSFLAHLHKAHAEGAPLVDGYAPFCKHMFIPNFVGHMHVIIWCDLTETFFLVTYNVRQDSMEALISKSAVHKICDLHRLCFTT